MYTFIGLLSHFETLKSILKNACKKKKILSFLQQFSNNYLENCSSEPVKRLGSNSGPFLNVPAYWKYSKVNYDGSLVFHSIEGVDLCNHLQ